MISMDLFTPMNLIFAGAILAGFYMAANIGANDVANAMGTSVGSKALTLKQAVFIAAIFEFAGAFLVGSHVTDTIRKGIVDPEQVTAALEPFLFALGMLAALISAGTWLNIASRMGWPVSTTHSIVGAVLGFGVLVCGPRVVDWGVLLKIVSSWVISPLAGGAIAFFIFTAINRLVLDAKDSIRAMRFYVPLLAGMTVTLLALSIFLGGAHSFRMNRDTPTLFVLALGIGSAAALGFKLFMFMRRRNNHAAENNNIRDNYRRIEKNFAFLQVMTACYVAFAHGANDVANAVGPLAAVVSIVRDGCVAMRVAVPAWVLLLGASGIVFGLAAFGYRVIETVGRKITEMSPSRGFAAEFSAATTVLACSKMGLPISTTHTLVGSVIGVGLARGIAALNFGILRQLAVAWVLEIPSVAVMTAVIYYILKGLFFTF